jgi:hypothetical protein
MTYKGYEHSAWPSRKRLSIVRVHCCSWTQAFAVYPALRTQQASLRDRLQNSRGLDTTRPSSLHHYTVYPQRAHLHPPLNNLHHGLPQHVEQWPEHHSKLPECHKHSAAFRPASQLTHVWPMGSVYCGCPARQRVPARWRQGKRPESTKHGRYVNSRNKTQLVRGKTTELWGHRRDLGMEHYTPARDRIVGERHYKLDVLRPPTPREALWKAYKADIAQRASLSI